MLVPCGRVQRRVCLHDSGVFRGRHHLTSLVPAGKPTITTNAHRKHGQGGLPGQPPLSSDYPVHFVAFCLYFDVSKIIARYYERVVKLIFSFLFKIIHSVYFIFLCFVRFRK